MVVLNADGFYTGLLTWLESLAPTGFVRRESLDHLIVVDTLDAALAALPR